MTKVKYIFSCFNIEILIRKPFLYYNIDLQKKRMKNQMLLQLLVVFFAFQFIAVSENCSEFDEYVAKF